MTRLEFWEGKRRGYSQRRDEWSRRVSCEPNEASKTTRAGRGANTRGSGCEAGAT